MACTCHQVAKRILLVEQRYIFNVVRIVVVSPVGIEDMQDAACLLVGFLKTDMTGILVDNLDNTVSVTVKDDDCHREEVVLEVYYLLCKEALKAVPQLPQTNIFVACGNGLTAAYGGSIHILQPTAVAGQRIEELVLRHHAVLIYQFLNLIRKLIVLTPTYHGVLF